MKKTLVLISIVLLISSTGLYSQDSTNESKEIEIKVDTIKLSEAEAYKMLYENQVSSNNAILKTIYYALGGLATAIISVFAGNWWFNEKKVKEMADGIDLQISKAKNEAIGEVREKVNNMTRQKTSEINNLMTKLLNEANNQAKDLSSKMSELSDKIKSDSRTDHQTLNEAYESRLKSFSENIVTQISTLEKQFNIRLEGLEQKNSTTETSLNDKINKKSNSLDNKFSTELKYIKRRLHENSAQISEAKGSFNNAFREYLELVQLDLDSDFYLSYSLKDMYSTLLKVDYIWEDEKEKLEEILKKIEREDEIKLGIIEKLNSIKIQKFNYST